MVVITGVAIVRSKKPLKLILAEAKYELMYNAVGSKGVLEDYLMRAKNKTGNIFLRTLFSGFLHGNIHESFK